MPFSYRDFQFLRQSLIFCCYQLLVLPSVIKNDSHTLYILVLCLFISSAEALMKQRKLETNLPVILHIDNMCECMCEYIYIYLEAGIVRHPWIHLYIS